MPHITARALSIVMLAALAPGEARALSASFSDATSIDRVRSHAPSNLPDGTDTGLTALTTGGLVMYGFGLNLKYQF